MKYIIALLLFVSPAIAHTADLAADKIRKPSLTCDQVREFVRIYGEEESLRRASLLGLSKKTVDYIIRTCFGKTANH